MEKKEKIQEIQDHIQRLLEIESSMFDRDLVLEDQKIDELCAGLFSVYKDALARHIMDKQQDKKKIFSLCFRALPIEINVEITDELYCAQLMSHGFFDKDQNEYKVLRIIILRALNHCREKIDNKTLAKATHYEKGTDYVELFREFVGVNKQGGSGDAKAPLLPDTFCYQLLPDSVTIRAMTKNRDFFFEENNYHINVIPNFQDAEEKEFIDEKEKSKWVRDQKQKRTRLIKFLSYFQQGEVDYPAIEQADLEAAQSVLKEKFIGIQEFSSLVAYKMKQFTSTVHAHSKGMIFYGPPGTGKSAISICLMREVGFHFVTEPMAAGDIKKGIVGDSEATLNSIADRARLVPWDTCVLLIDEIDSLVPERNNKQQEGGNNSKDLVGVFLSLMDGHKVVPNLKVVGTTNLLLSIDEAVRRRLDIQIFLGNPSRKQRALWIDQKKNHIDRKLKNRHDNEYYINFKKLIKDQGLRDLLINSTLNFSADALRKVIEGFFEHLITEKYTLRECQELLIKKVKEVSIETNIVFGSLFVIDVLLQKQDLDMHIDQLSYQSLLKIPSKDKVLRGRTEVKSSKRMLITPCADITRTNEFVQIEMLESLQWTPDDEHIYNRLLKVINEQSEVTLRFLLCIFLQFPDVNYALNGQKIIKLEDIRQSVLKNYNTRYLKEKYDVNVKKYLLEEYKGELSQYDQHYIQLKLDFDKLIQKYQQQGDHSVSLQNLALEFLVALNEKRKTKYELKSFKVFEESQILQKGWKYITLKLAEEYNADMVVLIDSYYLEMKNASDDKEVQSHIYRVISDMKLYSRCIIIFDLDSISFIKEEYSGLCEQLKAPSLMGLQSFNNQAKFSYSVQRQGALNACLDLIYNADPNGSIWYIAVSSHNKIILDYRMKMQWPQAKSALQYEEEEAERDVKYKCPTCNEVFTLRENESTELKCKVHEKYDQLLFEDKDIKQIVDIATAHVKIQDENKLPTMFKYLCCQATYGAKGCRSTQHDSKNAKKYSTTLLENDHKSQSESKLQ